MKFRFLFLLSLFPVFLSAQSFEERYRQFRQQAKQDYTDFRSAANQRYANFLRSAWEYYRLAPAIPRPKEEQVPPVVYDEQNQRDNGQKRDDNNIPYEDITPRPNPTPQPQPVSPVIQHNEHVTILQVDFFGTSLSFRYPETAFSLPSIQGDNLAEAWELLATEQYDNLLYDCLSARDRLQLCDWAYLSLLQLVSEQACGKGNAAVLLQAFLYVQSGYQMRLAADRQGNLYLLIGSRYVFYDRGYFELDEGRFFPLKDISQVADGLTICNGAFED